MERVRKSHPSMFADIDKEPWPHDGHKLNSPHRHVLVKEYLLNLSRARTHEEPEVLLWTLCAGVWWLNPEQAAELADVIVKMLSE